MNQLRPAGHHLVAGIVVAAQLFWASSALGAVVKKVTLGDSRSVGHGYGASMTQLKIETDGPVVYQDFILSNPDRLVIDCLESTSLAPPVLDLGGESALVRSVTTSQWNGEEGESVVRLVCELATRCSYSIAERPTGLLVIIDGGKSAADGLGYDEDRMAALEIFPVAENVRERPIENALASPLVANPAEYPENQPLFVIKPKEEAQHYNARAYGPEVLGGGQRLGGRPGSLDPNAKKVSLDVQRASVQTVLRTLAELSGRNIVSNQDVSGEVTVRVNEIPWPQALDIVLLTQGLGFTDEEGILRIASLDELRKEQLEQQTAARKAEELMPLETRVIRLGFAKAEEVKPSIVELLTQRGHAEVDERTNSIVVTDITERVSMAGALITQLDTRTPQVEIESKLVDLDVSESSDLGIDWTFVVTQDGSGDLNRPQSFHSINPIGGPAGELRVGAIKEDWTVDAIMQALAESRDANIISNPRITTVNNREASIMVGQEIPLVVQDEAFNTVIQLKQIGIKLSVRPHINSDGQIELDVHPEVSDLASQATVQGGIIINTSEADTRVLVDNGETAVIGGLIRENEATQIRGIPLLKDIPALGWLFRSESKVQQKRELLIFITPRIVDA
jgi:type IV pilus secretin PilQ/predicted competence protein